MKALATTLLVIGLIVFLASSTLFAYHFATIGDPTMSDAVGIITSGALACFAVFMRSRAIAGIRTFQVTEKDRAELREFRRELGIRRILARLLGTFAGLCFVGGAMSLLHRDASGRADWHIAVVMIILSQILVLCVWLLARKRDDVA